MKAPIFWLSHLVAVAVAPRIVRAVTPSARYGGGCVYFKPKIYCYGGGNIVTGQTWPLTSDDFYTLDLSNDFAVSNAGASWTPVEAKGIVKAEPNFLFVMAALPQNNSFVMNGGMGYNNQTALTHQTIAFDIKTETWKHIDSAGALQTRQSTMVVSNDTMVHIWGGNSDQFTGYTLGEDYSRDMKILNFKSLNWTASMLPAAIPTRIEHTGTLGSDGRTIYYIGGLTATQVLDATGAVTYQVAGIAMSDIVVYDTTAGQWTQRQSAGPTPTARRLHAAALIPNTTRIVVYGGAEATGERPLSDFCYVLETSTLQWQQVGFNDASGGAGPRYGHSMIMAGADNLFVIFGIDSTGATRNDFHVLNVSNWTWVDNFVGVVPRPPETKPSESPEPTNTDADDESPSSGAIAGAVIGAVAAVSLLAVAVLFVMRRKRQNTSNSEGDDEVFVYKNEHQSDNGSKIYAPATVVTRDNHNQSAFYMPSTISPLPPIQQQHQLENLNTSPFSDVYSTQNHNNSSAIVAAASSSPSSTATGYYYYDGEKSQVPTTPVDRAALSPSPASFEKPNAVPRLVFQAVKPDGG
ncbi:hypothetical protein BJV82DRAFT_586556 [Fennellomyces sp. T-0311]|nr:hypothetical protein BJV82DRAFT_586556 [Fennellomyces sp. T-0311]